MIFLFSILTVSLGSRCTLEERSSWINDYEFTSIYQRISLKSWGAHEKTLNGLVSELGETEKYKLVSKECLFCLAEATSCGVRYCVVQCAINAAYPICQNCVNKNCMPALLVCAGADSVADLPLPPTLAPSVTADVQSDSDGDDESSDNDEEEEEMRPKEKFSLNGRSFTMMDESDEDSFVVVDDIREAAEIVETTPEIREPAETFLAQNPQSSQIHTSATVEHESTSTTVEPTTTIFFSRREINFIIGGVITAIFAALVLHRSY